MLTGCKIGAFPGVWSGVWQCLSIVYGFIFIKVDIKSCANLGVETNVASLNGERAVLNLVLKWMLMN